MLSRLPNDIDVDTHIRSIMFNKTGNAGNSSWVGSTSLQAGADTEGGQMTVSGLLGDKAEHTTAIVVR